MILGFEIVKHNSHGNILSDPDEKTPNKIHLIIFYVNFQYIHAVDSPANQESQAMSPDSVYTVHKTTLQAHAIHS